MKKLIDILKLTGAGFLLVAMIAFFTGYEQVATYSMATSVFMFAIIIALHVGNAYHEHTLRRRREI